MTNLCYSHSSYIFYLKDGNKDSNDLQKVIQDYYNNKKSLISPKIQGKKNGVVLSTKLGEVMLKYPNSILIHEEVKSL